MKKRRCTGEKIAFSLRQHEGGTPIAAIVRKLGVTEPTFYRWKKKYGGLGVKELTPVLVADLLPLSFGTAAQGFTAATGEHVFTVEVDNLVVRRIDCDDLQKVAIIEAVPTDPVAVGETVIRC